MQHDSPISGIRERDPIWTIYGDLEGLEDDIELAKDEFGYAVNRGLAATAIEWIVASAVEPASPWGWIALGVAVVCAVVAWVGAWRWCRKAENLEERERATLERIVDLEQSRLEGTVAA